MLSRITQTTSRAIGSVYAGAACTTIILVSGIVMGFNETWKSVTDSLTGILSLIMMFALQYTANRDNKALHLKLDRLILSDDKADNALVALEELPDGELAEAEEKIKEAISN